MAVEPSRRGVEGVGWVFIVGLLEVWGGGWCLGVVGCRFGNWGRELGGEGEEVANDWSEESASGVGPKHVCKGAVLRLLGMIQIPQREDEAGGSIFQN